MLRRSIHHFCAFAWIVALPAVAAAATEAPEPLEQFELESGWSAEMIVDGGAANELQLFRSIGETVALGLEMESEGSRIEGFGVAAMVGVTDNFGLLFQLDADARGRPGEATALVIAEGARGRWSATANLAYRRGWRGELTGQSVDYAWGLRAALTPRLALGAEGAGRIAASPARRAEGLRGHFVGLGLALTPRARGAPAPEFAISVLREARVGKAPALLRASIQIHLARNFRALRQQED